MSHWGYTATNGPSTWKKCYPIAKGKQQSPIDIVTSKAKYNGDLGKEPLKTDYSPEAELCLKNNGHSIMCQIKQKSELSGGPLTGRYRLEQFHLHWGAQDDRGSEHTIDGKCYAGELHLVHYNSSKYGCYHEAEDKADGLAVLGILIQVGTEHQTFRTIVDSIADLTKSGSEVNVSTRFDPTCLLPGNTSQYWTYKGSLTTPPLYESVQWIVFKEPVEFSKDQLSKLRSLQDSDGQNMQDNFRPPLSLQGRKVKSSFPKQINSNTGLVPVEFSKDQLSKLRSLVDSDGQKMQDNFRPPLPLHGREVKKAKSDFTAQRNKFRKSCQTTGRGPPLPAMSQTSQDIVDLFPGTASFSELLPSSHEKEEDPQVKETDSSEDTGDISGSGGSKKKGQRNVRSQKTLKELQIEYFETGIQLQKAQLECFEKLSKMADMYLMKHDTV